MEITSSLSGILVYIGHRHPINGDRSDVVGAQEVPKAGNPDGSVPENLMCLSEVEIFFAVMTEEMFWWVYPEGNGFPQ